MHLLNLSLFELSALLGATLAIVTALYLLDKTRKRRVVSTLRFWREVQESTHARNRARVEQPWSLLLQLLALALLILAIAGLEWNSHMQRPRGHVLIVDASSAAARILPDERRLAKEYLSRLSPADSVMLVEASGLIVPRTGFTTNREQTGRDLDAIRASDTVLALDRALDAARQSRAFAPGSPGEIVYIGPARVSDASNVTVPGLRFLRVDAPPERPHIAALSAQAGATPGVWIASVRVRNDGRETALIHLQTSFGASEFTLRTFTLAPGAARRENYDFRVTGPGMLKAAIENSSSAVLALPRNGPVQIVAYTNRAAELRPLLGSDPRIDVRFAAPSTYRPDPTGADLIVLDNFTPGTPPQSPSLWFDPPESSKEVANVTITGWTQDPKLGLGLQSRDLRLPQARVLVHEDGDVVIASIAAGPVALANPAKHQVVLGFDPMAGAARLALTSPLLIANAVRWLAPDAFSSRDAACAEVGTAVIDLPEQARDGTVTVTGDSRTPVPFVRRGNTVEFYVDSPSDIDIDSGAWTRKLSLRLPQVAAADWKPARAISTALPATHGPIAANAQLWRTLSIAAGILLLLDWLFFGRQPRAATLCLRVAVTAVLLVACFAPSIHFASTKTAAIALVDTSRPIDSHELTKLTQDLKNLSQERGRNTLVVVPFAETNLSGDRPAQISASRRSEADLEGALTASVAAAPAGYQPRIVLFTDGHENHGSAARAVAALRRVHVPVDTAPLHSAGAKHLSIASLTAPQAGFAGELLPLSISVDAPRSGSAQLRVAAEGKTLGEQTVELQPGRNVIRSEARVNTTGAVVIAAKVESDELGEASLDAVVQLSRAHLLYYSQDLPGTEGNLLAVMKSAGFDINTDPRALDGDLSADQVIVLNNVDTGVLPQSQKLALSNFVENGGGLLLIGGEHQVYKEDKQLDALDRVLPAKLAPPRNPEGICVALIIDKSSSMEGRKIDLARLSAIGVVDHLTPRDNIGVLMFDNSYEWAVPMRKAVDKESIKTLISGITPDGGTQIAPALNEAYRRVMRSDSAYKHIVLLTDGISEEGDSFELAAEALAHHVTISTVGLGQDVNRSYLERIAMLSGGRSYFLNNPQGLQQILLKDVQDYTGSTTVEKPLAAAIKTPAEVLDGVGMEHAPPLKGYARFEAKPDAETLLTIDQDKHDPLFIRWQYGLGRAAIFASDAKSRWAEAWMTWPGYDKFWTNVLHDLLTRNNQTDARAEFDSTNETLRIRYELPAAAKLERAPEFYALGPDGFARTLRLNETSPGTFEGSVEIGKRTGVFRVRPLVASALFPEIGLNRQEDDDQNGSVDEQLLQSIAAQTGGRYNPPLNSIFEPGTTASMVAIPLWPALLALVVVLDICELALRRRGAWLIFTRYVRLLSFGRNGLGWSRLRLNT